jgi:hypothetical protein
VLELILTTPIFLIIMLAIVEFSLIYTAIEQAAFASRSAAKIASETASGSLSGLVTNGDLKSFVDRYLRVGGLPEGSCRVILEYNVDTGGTKQDRVYPNPAVNGCNCVASSTPLPAVGGTTNDESVRTTVCVRLGGNIPDFLGDLGFSIENYVVEETTTYMHEL